MFTPQSHQPPSDYAIYSLVQGKPGALVEVAWLTAERTVLIFPGLWLAGFRGSSLLKATLAATLSITAGLIVYYRLHAPEGGSR